MRLLACLLSMTLFSCNAYSKDPLNNYDPEDQVMIDDKGKIRVIEDESLKGENKEKSAGRVCLTLRLDEKDEFVFDVKKCAKDS